MKVLRFFKIVIIVISVFTCLPLFIYFIMPKIVDVHEITKHPELYEGSVGIVGEVYVNKSGSFLLLDCGENTGCAAIPVAYEGTRPEPESKIIAYGQIKRQSRGRRYISLFKAYIINVKGDDFKGNLLYETRKSVRKGVIAYREWLYSKCNKCFTLKRKLISTPLFP